MDINDTSFPEEYVALRDECIRNGDAFVLAFSISNRHAFSQIKTFYKQIQDIKNKTMPLILIGNKSDLVSDWREVSSQESIALAEELGCEFIETSAKDGTNVEKAFCDLVRKARLSEGQQKSPSKSGPIKQKNDCPLEPTGGKKSWRNSLSKLLGSLTKTRE